MVQNSNLSDDRPKKEQSLIEERGSYWHRACRDWRLLIAAALVLVAIASYLLTGDLGWRPHGIWHKTVESSDKKGTDLTPVAAGQ